MAMIQVKPRSEFPGGHLDIRTPHQAQQLAMSIRVAVPFTTSINPELIELMMAWKEAGIDVQPYRNSGGFLEITRANIAYDFLKEGSAQRPLTYLVCIDADVIPDNPEAPLMLARHNLPIVAGVVPIFHPQAGMVGNFQIDHKGSQMWARTDAGVKIPREGLGEVSWAGLGMMCIHRDVLARFDGLKSNSPFLIPDQKRDQAARTGIIDHTEDKHFCEMARAFKYPVVVDFGQRGAHIKQERYSWPAANLG